jgi:hypothetical protein
MACAKSLALVMPAVQTGGGSHGANPQDFDKKEL